MRLNPRLIWQYFRSVRSTADWPACALLALGACALEPRKTKTKWGSRILPRRIGLHFKRFGPLQVKLNPANWTHQAVLREFLFEGVYDLDKVPFVPAHIIDCGAHIGLFVRLCRYRYPQVRITAFEPQFENVALVHDVPPAGLLAVHQSAVGAEDGVVYFNDHALRGFGFVATGESNDAPGVHAVPLVGLPKLISELGDRLLVKIDIEGAEREVLPALVKVLPKNCAVFLETHHGDEAWTATCRLFAEAGFRAERLKVSDYSNECIDGFFVRAASI